MKRILSPTMSKKKPDIATRRAYALALKAEVQALGGLCGGIPGFEENHPDSAIDFYKRVLAEDRKINGAQISGPN